MQAFVDHVDGMEEVSAGDVRLAELHIVDREMMGRECLITDLNGNRESYNYSGYRLETRGEELVVVFCFG